MSRATEYNSAIVYSEPVKASVMTATRPKSSLTCGPTAPSGNRGARSSILLRSFDQMGAMSL